MISELYTDALLDAAASIPPASRLDGPDGSATRVSRVCGSELEVDIKLTDGVVADFAMRARACALGQAAASVMARTIIGASPDELFRLRDEMRAMLKMDGPAPAAERWRDFAMFQSIRDYPQRHASTLLVFEAVSDALVAAGIER